MKGLLHENSCSSLFLLRKWQNSAMKRIGDPRKIRTPKIIAVNFPIISSLKPLASDFDAAATGYHANSYISLCRAGQKLYNKRM